METYPIIIDGALAGKLTVERQGPRTAFDAVCAMQPGLLRISVYGGGREGYLGLLAPEGERLTLHRAFSRSQLRDFPREIERVERAGLPPEAPAAAEAGEPEPETPESEPSPEPNAPETEPVPEPEAAPEPAMEPTPPEPEAREPAPPEEPLDWFASPDGALVCSDGLRRLIALPLGDERIPEGIPGERRQIEGREYLVYRTRDDRLES